MVSSSDIATLMEQAQKVIATLDKVALKLADEGTIDQCKLPLLSSPKADDEPSKPNVSRLPTESSCNYDPNEPQFARILPGTDAHKVFDEMSEPVLSSNHTQNVALVDENGVYENDETVAHQVFDDLSTSTTNSIPLQLSDFQDGLQAPIVHKMKDKVTWYNYSNQRNHGIELYMVLVDKNQECLLKSSMHRGQRARICGALNDSHMVNIAVICAPGAQLGRLQTLNSNLCQHYAVVYHEDDKMLGGNTFSVLAYSQVRCDKAVIPIKSNQWSTWAQRIYCKRLGAKGSYKYFDPGIGVIKVVLSYNPTLEDKGDFRGEDVVGDTKEKVGNVDAYEVLTEDRGEKLGMVHNFEVQVQQSGIGNDPTLEEGIITDVVVADKASQEQKSGLSSYTILGEGIVTRMDDRSRAPKMERDFKVVIKLDARVDLHHLGMFLQGRQADAPQEALQVLDIVLRELPTSRFSLVGRSFYSPDLGRRQPLGDGLESWRGLYQSVRPTQVGLSLNIDMSSTAFIEPLHVLDFVTHLLNMYVTSRPSFDSDIVKIKKALRRVKVEVTHRGNMRKKYRLFVLTSHVTRELTILVDEKSTLKSVVEYFCETCGFNIQVGNTQRSNYLPMELCNIMKGQRYHTRLNEHQIVALLKVTCQRPQERERDIVETVHYNAYHIDPSTHEVGIKTDHSLASVEAPVHPAPWLKYSVQIYTHTLFVFDPGGYDSEPTMTKRPQVYSYGAKQRKFKRPEDYQSYVFDPGGSLVLQDHKSVTLWGMEAVMSFILEDKDNFKGSVLIHTKNIMEGRLVIYLFISYSPS